MRWLRRAIGLVRVTTQRAGHALQMAACLIGGERSTAELRLSVSQEQKQEPSRAPRTTAARSRKAGTSSARTHTKKSSTSGTAQATPARQIRQPASQAVKAKRSVAPSTKAVASIAPEQVSAPTPTASQSGNRGKSKTAASKTRQPALLEQKPAPKVVKQTKPAAKRTLVKAPVQTRTDSPSGSRGR